MSETKNTLFLLDAYALIYRSFFALNKNPRINSKGLNTSAIIGFLNTLYDVIKNQQPTHLGVAFDLGGASERLEYFAEYKANRQEMPEDLRESIPYIMELIRGFNIPILVAEGYEADDVIGTLAKKAEREGFITYMMTPDKDFGQLVSDNILIYKPAKYGEPAKIIGPDEVCQKYGIQHPSQMIDLLGLWGDSSDNIPGIPKIGEKTAALLIQKYGSMENMLQHTDELKGKQREYIEQYAEQGLLSKRLATINIDVPIDFDAESLRLTEPNVPALLKFFEEMEFKTFSKRFIEDIKKQQKDTSTSQANSTQYDLFSNSDTTEEIGIFDINNKHTLQNTEHSYVLVDDDDAIQELGNKLKAHGSFVFDTETTSLNTTEAELVGIAFSIEPHKAYYVSFSDDRTICQARIEILRDIFEDKELLKIGQNLKYDISILRNYNIEVCGPLFDTMIAHYLLEPDQRHNMDYMAEAYLNYSPLPIEELIGKGKGQRSMRDVSKELVKEYAGEDADITYQLYEILEEKLQKDNLKDLFYNIEMPLVSVLSHMECNGVRIDATNLKQISQEFAEEIRKIEEHIYNLAGTTFQISSPKQLGEVLFDHLKIQSKAKKTKTGQYATGEDILQKLINEHPIINYILEYRSLTKLKSTYIDALPALTSPIDGLIHTSYNQAVTATGRLSSTNPNLQNIPIRTEKGKEIRRAFVPRSPDYLMMAADYSQIELRIIAHLSGDTTMIQDFNLGHDIHAATAAKVFHLPIEEVSKEQRRAAKMVNFGIIYGISAFGLAERLGIARKEASDIIKSYFEEYRGIKEYMDKSIDFARSNGYAETMLGRRRYLRDINASNAVVRGFAERNAINAPIQGSSADMIKIAMANIHKVIQENGLKSKMILQVHDELVFDVFREELDFLRSMVKQKMESALPLSVPVIVEINTGNNWLEAH